MARLQRTFQRTMARVLSQPLDLHRFSLTSALMRRSKLLYSLVHVSLCRFSPTPTQSTCLYYYHDNEASKCAGFPRAQVLDCGDPPPGPCCPLRPSKTPARSCSLKRNGPSARIAGRVPLRHGRQLHLRRSGAEAGRRRHCSAGAFWCRHRHHPISV